MFNSCLRIRNKTEVAQCDQRATYCANEALTILKILLDSKWKMHRVLRNKSSEKEKFNCLRTELSPLASQGYTPAPTSLTRHYNV